MAKRILLTCVVTLLYCLMWSILEMIIYGQIEYRIVDDIMILLFIPTIWEAAKKEV